MDTEKVQMDSMPIQSDVSEMLPLKEQIKGMNRNQLVKKADELGYQIDEKVEVKAIREAILTIDAEHKSNAKKTNEESLVMAVTETDPMIEVRFFNMESPNTDIEFAYSGKRGMYSKAFIRDGKTYGNPNGFKKCPKYHLFPGEVARLAYSVYEHLTSLTFMTHKTVFDNVTGMIKGNIPIIKPRFILQLLLSKEDIININKNK